MDPGKMEMLLRPKEGPRERIEPAGWKEEKSQPGRRMPEFGTLVSERCWW